MLLVPSTAELACVRRNWEFNQASTCLSGNACRSALSHWHRRDVNPWINVNALAINSLILVSEKSAWQKPDYNLMLRRHGELYEHPCIRCPWPERCFYVISLSLADCSLSVLEMCLMPITECSTVIYRNSEHRGSGTPRYFVALSVRSLFSVIAVADDFL